MGVPKSCRLAPVLSLPCPSKPRFFGHPPMQSIRPPKPLGPRPVLKSATSASHSLPPALAVCCHLRLPNTASWSCNLAPRQRNQTMPQCAGENKGCNVSSDSASVSPLQGLPLNLLRGFLIGVLLVLLLWDSVIPWVVFSTVLCAAYALLLIRVAVPPRPGLPNHGLTPLQQLGTFLSRQAFQVYANASLFTGFVLPAIYTMGASAAKDRGMTAQGCCYLFSLVTQLLGETMLVTSPWCSVPGFALWNIMFNSIRLGQLWLWWTSVAARSYDVYLGRVGVLLVSLLLLIWVVNLFVFLIPISLPYAFNCYFTGDT